MKMKKTKRRDTGTVDARQQRVNSAGALWDKGHKAKWFPDDRIPKGVVLWRERGPTSKAEMGGDLSR